MRKFLISLLFVIYNYILRWRLRWDRFHRQVSRQYLHLLVAFRRIYPKRDWVSYRYRNHLTAADECWDIFNKDLPIMSFLKHYNDPSRLYDYTDLKEFANKYGITKTSFDIFQQGRKVMHYSAVLDFAKDRLCLSAPKYDAEYLLREFEDDIILNTFSLDPNYLMSTYN